MNPNELVQHLFEMRSNGIISEQTYLNMMVKLMSSNEKSSFILPQLVQNDPKNIQAIFDILYDPLINPHDRLRLKSVE